MTVDRVSVASSLTHPDAAVDLIDSWIDVAEDTSRSFAEQTVVEAERGDIDAALYADSARIFADASRANLAAIREAIVAGTSAATSLCASVVP